MDVCLLWVLCCQVEVSAMSWSLIQRSPTTYGASLYGIQKPCEWEGPGPLGAVMPPPSKTQVLKFISLQLSEDMFRKSHRANIMCQTTDVADNRVTARCFIQLICYAWFQASASAWMKPPFFWITTQHRTIILCWHFGTSWWSHLHTWNNPHCCSTLRTNSDERRFQLESYFKST